MWINLHDKFSICGQDSTGQNVLSVSNTATWGKRQVCDLFYEEEVDDTFLINTVEGLSMCLWSHILYDLKMNENIFSLMP